MSLIEQVDQQRRNIQTDGYPMSISELSNMYRDGELDIHPEFQRFYRWSNEQKSRFIESLLLGIPIPSIFVHQRADGVWDVIDGLQRLSTILQFLGLLKDEFGNKVEPLVLTATKLLPALDGVAWDDESLEPLPTTLKLIVKRSKLDVKIILRESDESSKFELFQRLNTGGSRLSDQEVRNCILVMENPDFYQWLRGLASHEDFRACVALTDRAVEEQYDVELVVRFLTLRQKTDEDLKSIGDLGDFLTEEIRRSATSSSYNRAKEEEVFTSTFAALANDAGIDSFRRYNAAKQKFEGGFLISAFETVAIGGSDSADDGQLKVSSQGIRELWGRHDFRQGIGSGIRASTRIPLTVPLGRELFR